MSTIFNYYHSAPAWSKLGIALIILYLSYQIWSKILRTRREVQAASWILNQRRRAGIPDSDKRPFKIAKAAVDATRKQSTTSETAPSHPPATISQSPSVQQQHQHQHQHHQQNSLTTSSKRLASHSGTSANPSEKINSRLSTHPKSSSFNTLTHQTTTRTSEPKQHHQLSSAPSSLKPPHSTRKPKSNEPLIDKSNQKRVLPISTDGSDPEQSETEAERSTSRNRKKARTQNDRSNPNIPSQLNNELSTTETGPTTANVQRKKRILSDCVSEADADQAMRIKKGRSEKVSDLPGLERTPEADDLMRLDDEEEGAEDDQVRVEVEQEEGEEDEEKESDQELYMVTDDGRKKKLVKIRLGSPESAESHEENNVEQRWVTHKEFRRLKQDHKLLLDDDRWDSESIISSSDSLDSEPNHLSTPSKQSAERGPIWSIEGKPRSNPILPATELPLRVRPVSRPRNSLGRMRLSLPPDPASPSQLPRSRLVSPLRPSIS
ncbi:hypothetical protein PGT21_035046 [Puccinia graminis f. sp. tritici]|uniref:Uncharacterized protein n=1 Tax=Puccinia graminis f. sp. tritici TaxID=56615 RepID=A0A5B0MHC7_PUCGR|nr:hypothetical protein PGT21_035046 [Puccinia graminis f. sp. tritici]